MTIHLHEGDLPADVDLGDVIAVDTETMGLSTARDRLCLIQLCAGDDEAHLVRFPHRDRPYVAPNLVSLLADPAVIVDGLDRGCPGTQPGIRELKDLQQ